MNFVIGLVALLSFNTNASPIEDLKIEVQYDDNIDESKNPVFQWDYDFHDANDGKEERMTIDFNDGGPPDTVILQATQGLIPYENGLKEDNCILSGYMTNESNVYVAVNGCPKSNSFHVRYN